MGFYVGNEYHIVRAEEMDLFTSFIGATMFIFQGLYTRRLIKAKVKEDFSIIVEEALNEKIEIIKIPTIQDVEKLRLDFTNKESVFNYYMHTTENYDLYKKDKIYNALDRLFIDLDRNSHKYFQIRLIKDFFNDLQANIQDYLLIEKYKECLENPKNITLAVDENQGEHTLENLINNDIIYAKLINGLKKIEFIDNEGNIIPSQRVRTDVAILFIKLLEVKFSNIKNLPEPEIIRIMKNSFGTFAKVKYFNGLKNENLHLDPDLDKKITKNKIFYDKLKFIDAIDN